MHHTCIVVVVQYRSGGCTRALFRNLLCGCLTSLVQMNYITPFSPFIVRATVARILHTKKAPLLSRSVSTTSTGKAGSALTSLLFSGQSVFWGWKELCSFVVSTNVDCNSNVWQVQSRKFLRPSRPSCMCSCRGQSTIVYVNGSKRTCA